MKRYISSPPLIYWIEWLNLFLCFYLFLTLKLGGERVCFTLLDISTLKAVFLLFLSSHLECQPVFYSEAALPISLSNLLALILLFFSLLKRRRYHYWLNQIWMHRVRRRFVRSAFLFLKIVCRCLNREDVCESFQSLLSCTLNTVLSCSACSSVTAAVLSYDSSKKKYI